MTKTELLELLQHGENSGVEFKRDDVENHELAKEQLVAFLNLEGGAVLLGIEDDGTVSGTTRPDLEEWVAELCRSKIEPRIVPHLSCVRAVEPGKDCPDRSRFPRTRQALRPGAQQPSHVFHPRGGHQPRGQPGRAGAHVPGLRAGPVRPQARTRCHAGRSRPAPTPRLLHTRPRRERTRRCRRRGMGETPAQPGPRDGVLRPGCAEHRLHAAVRQDAQALPAAVGHPCVVLPRSDARLRYPGGRRPQRTDGATCQCRRHGHRVWPGGTGA